MYHSRLILGCSQNSYVRNSLLILVLYFFSVYLNLIRFPAIGAELVGYPTIIGLPAVGSRARGLSYLIELPAVGGRARGLSYLIV